MRVVSLLVATLLLAAPVFAQQALSSASTASQAITSTVDQPPAHPITPAQVHEIMELTGASRAEGQIMRVEWSKVEKALPAFWPKDATNDLKSELLRLDLEPLFVNVYQKYLSTQDAAQIIAFYKTPAGQKLISVSPQISRELQLVGANAGHRISQEVIARHADEIKAAFVKYQAAHSDTSKITSPN